MTHEQAARAGLTDYTERFHRWAEKSLTRLREWSERVPGLHRRAPGAGQVAIALDGAGIALATAHRAPGARPRLTRCEFHPLPRQSDPGLVLRTASLQAGLDDPRYRLVLNSDEYQTHLVESPGVPDSELREAVRWRIRDLIDFPVDEAAIDVFDMPQQAGTGREAERTMCVVAARTPVIADKVALINRSGGELEVVDITDLALRNLLTLTPADRSGAGLLYVESSYSLILITSDSTLYLSRRIWIGQGDLDAIAGKDAQDEDFRRIADALAMELLRSLEYYEAHFSRPGVDALYLAPSGAANPQLQPYLSQAIGVSVQPLELEPLMDGVAGVPPELQARCLLAIGSALRQDRATL